MLERYAEERAAAWKQLEQIFKTIPAEQCSLKRNETTGELGWYAPSGFAFRVTGQFIVDSDQENMVFKYKPQDSADMVIAEHRALYQDYYEWTAGDKEQALALLVEDLEDYSGEYEAPEFFIGKWLVMSPNIDGSDCSIDSSPTTAPTLKIKKEVHSWYDRDYLERIDNLTPGAAKPNPCTFESAQGFVEWMQYYAELIPEHSKVELVEAEEEIPEFFVPEPVDHTEVVLPMEVSFPGMTSEEYCDWYGKMMNIEYTEGDRIALMRERRLQGFPFSDDPLKDLLIVTEPEARRLLDNSDI